MSFSRRSVVALFATLLCLAALMWLDAPAARADVIPDGKRSAELVLTLENVADFPDWVVFVSRPSGGSHQVVEAGPVPGAGGRAYQTKYMPTLYAMKKSDYAAKRAAIDAPMPASGGDDDRLTKDPAILASKTSIVQNQWVAQSGPIAKIADVARITKLDASGFDIAFVKSTYILKDGSTKDVSWGSANDRPPFPGGEPSGASSTGQSGSGSGSGAAAGGKAGCGCELAGGRAPGAAAWGLALFGALVMLLRGRSRRHTRTRSGVSAAIVAGLFAATGCAGETGARSGTSTTSATGSGGAASGACADHCANGLLDCGEVGFDCGGDCAACTAFDVATVCGPGAALPWTSPHLVPVELPDGTPYADAVAEPEVRDFANARWLFFNDDPANGDKDLHHARWDDARQAFVVLGLLPGAFVETPAVDGNPTLDRDGRFYFVSTRSYPNPTESIHRATLAVSGSPASASLSGVERLDGLSRPDVPWITQGVQVAWDGAWLYFDEARFEGAIPSQSDLVAASKSGASFARLPDAELAALFGNVNTPTFLEYAEYPTHDGRELYFTRTWADATDLASAVMCLMVSTRSGASGPFGPAVNIAVAQPGPGVLMEAPSLSPDEKTLYYHRREPGEPYARLYALERP